MKLLLTGAFSYTPEQINELRKMAGKVIYIKDERKEIDKDVSDIDIVVCNNLFLYHPIEKFKQLKFIQLTSAGFDKVPMDYIKASNIKVENAKGVYSIPMAEWAVLMILQFYKKSRTFFRLQANHQWIKQRDLLELSGKTAVIAGFGSVGKEIAKRLKAFDVYIIGIDLIVSDVNLADEFYPCDHLDHVLCRADILILSLPITKETYHIINEDRLSKLKSSCIIINVARGALIDENALIKALQNKKIRGAALDVFENEPLNSDNPLWDLENVIITPHNSFASEKIADRLYALIAENIKNYVEHYNKTRSDYS